MEQSQLSLIALMIIHIHPTRIQPILWQAPRAVKPSRKFGVQPLLLGSIEIKLSYRILVQRRNL